MAFQRQGECNRCGECCGYPRATDGGQNNPWPGDWPDAIVDWTVEALSNEIPVFKLTGHPRLGGKTSGTVRIDRTNYSWAWVPGFGLCKSASDHACPVLGKRQSDGSVPCGVYGTQWHEIWAILCAPAPPLVLEAEAEVQRWFANCPSCSYTYREVVE